MTRRAAVFGARGFVGTAICRELALGVWEVGNPEAPRLLSDASRTAGPSSCLRPTEAIDTLANHIKGTDVVINAAGVATPVSGESSHLTGANILLPLAVSEACNLAHTRRFVHISTAAVQGGMSPLDESAPYRAESPYSNSKMLGERALLGGLPDGAPGRTVFMRPTSVHGPGREATRRLIRLARSPLASVLAPGRFPTPQVLVDNVGAAVAYLCQAQITPPPIVLQPSEGWPTGSFLQIFSGRHPHQIPASSGRLVLQVTRLLCGRGSRLGYYRRLELLWSGQAQASGWLAGAGFSPPYERDSWDRLVRDVVGGGGR
jgi:nucleoside-diphosphate-sugar epimerase